MRQGACAPIPEITRMRGSCAEVLTHSCITTVGTTGYPSLLHFSARIPAFSPTNHASSPQLCRHVHPTCVETIPLVQHTQHAPGMNGTRHRHAQVPHQCIIMIFCLHLQYLILPRMLAVCSKGSGGSRGLLQTLWRVHRILLCASCSLAVIPALELRIRTCMSSFRRWCSTRLVLCALGRWHSRSADAKSSIGVFGTHTMPQTIKRRHCQLRAAKHINCASHGTLNGS